MMVRQLTLLDYISGSRVNADVMAIHVSGSRKCLEVIAGLVRVKWLGKNEIIAYIPRSKKERVLNAFRNCIFRKT